MGMERSVSPVRSSSVLQVYEQTVRGLLELLLWAGSQRPDSSSLAGLLLSMIRQAWWKLTAEQCLEHAPVLPHTMALSANRSFSICS